MLTYVLQQLIYIDAEKFYPASEKHRDEKENQKQHLDKINGEQKLTLCGGSEPGELNEQALPTRTIKQS